LKSSGELSRVILCHRCFNLCLEPLLEEMGKNTGGININGGNKIPVLAFADHIVLLGKEKREAQNQPEGRASQIHEHIC
jgi:hypothetical protein